MNELNANHQELAGRVLGKNLQCPPGVDRVSVELGNSADLINARKWYLSQCGNMGGIYFSYYIEKDSGIPPKALGT